MSKASTDLANLERRIVQGEAELERMSTYWLNNGGICCPGCMFGRQWSDLEQKQQRREAWAAVLRKRVAKSKQDKLSILTRLIKRIFTK